MIITANDLKVKGVSYLDGLAKKYREIFISVRGKNRMVVLTIEEYERLKEADLEMAVREAEADYKKGKYIIESSEKHFKRLGI
jgi:prevent-host-death family protein